MILSMTGYGKSEFELHGEKFNVEIKSLNSKNADINCKLTYLLKSQEIFIRDLVKAEMVRGKIEVLIFKDIDNTESKKHLNKEAVKSYFAQIQEIAGDVGQQVNALELALQMPDVLEAAKSELQEGDLEMIQNAVLEASRQNTAYRAQEGASIGKDMLEKIAAIEALVPEVEQYENLRIEAVRGRINQAFNEAQVEIDKNRFEQELIFYLEKFDINEEKQRLLQNCTHFRQVVESESPSKGKKLNFICQEVGREVNTLGSKANHNEIQKIVIQMKDELEKIKEQSLNVL